MNWCLLNFLLLIFGLVCLTSAAISPIPRSEFNATADAIGFRRASDKRVHANTVFLVRSQKQRAHIAHIYKTLYNEELFPEPNGFLDFINEDSYAELLYTMSTPMTRIMALDMFDQDGPTFTTRTTLIDAIATLSNRWWKGICTFRDRYSWTKQFYTNYIKSEGYHFDDMVDAVTAGKRNESQKPDKVAAKKDAQFLHNIIEYRYQGENWEKDEHDVRDIFVNRSFGQIREIYFQYEQLYQHNLDYDIGNHYFQDYLVKNAILAIIRVHIDAPLYFAQRLYDTMHGRGTNEHDLNRIIITRSEIDMERIKVVFNEKYGMSLAAMIEDDTSGEYMKLLKAIIE